MPRPDYTSTKLGKQLKPVYTPKTVNKATSYSTDTDLLKIQTAKLARNIKDGSMIVGKGIANSSVVLGQGILKGSQIVGQGTVAALKGTKEGVQKGVSSFRKFLGVTAETLHLKKPDMQPLEQLEKKISSHLPSETLKRWAWKNIKLKPVLSKGNLVLKWTRVFCWHDDPFKPELLYPIDEFFVLEKEKKSALNRFLVKEEDFGTITGEKGSGKTIFLNWIHLELETHHPEVVPCIIDCSNKNITEAQLIKQLMYPFLNIYQKTVSRPFEEISAEQLTGYIKNKVRDKPFVLLIDNPQNISEKGYELFTMLQKTGIRLHIIVAGEKEELKKSSFGKGMKDTLKFEMTGIKPELAATLLKRRIEAVGGNGTYPFDQQMIKLICEHAKGNPMQILELAKERVIQLSIEHQEEIVTQQKEIIHRQEEAFRKKMMEERQKHIQERERQRLQREEERRRHQQAVEQQRLEEEKRNAAEVVREDMQLEKIDEIIGSLVETGEKAEAKEKEGKKIDELKRQDAVISQVIGHIPVEKSVSKVLEEDPSLAKELEQVFEETEKANKQKQESGKKKR